MDQAQYSTLMDALRHVLAPRHARGKQHARSVILTLIASTLDAGPRSGRAIAQWVVERRTALLRWLLPPRGRLPSESTLRLLDVTALEAQLARSTQQLDQPNDGAMPPQDGTCLQGQTIDGKAIRSARTHGVPIHVGATVWHGQAIVLAQERAPAKTNAIRAIPIPLRGRSLAGTLTTMDALLTQRAIAQQILDQGGHYLMVI